MDLSTLEDLTPLLMSTGIGAYGWLHVSKSEFAETECGRELHDVYRQQRLSARRHEQDIVAVINLLRSADIEPVLVKGWAIARHYEDPALRPYGDLDLCVAPAQFAKASEILRRVESVAGPFVDLHGGFNRIGVGKRLSHLLSTKTPCPLCLSGKCARHALRNRDTADTEAQREWDQIYSRTKLVSLPKVQRPKPNVSEANEDVGPWTLEVRQVFQVRVPSVEDHLRILCVHMLRSGARRPTWLCDVAEILSPQSNVQGPTSDPDPTPRSNIQSPKSVSATETLDLGRWTFDWDVCLDGNSVYSNYVATAVLLAHELLGVDISDTPFANRQLPRWIVDAVLEQWGGKAVQSPRPKVQSQEMENRRGTLDVGRWTKAFRRWDNPIRATAAVNGKFSNRPRLRYRLAELIARIPEAPDHWQVVIGDRGRSARNERVARTRP